MQRFLGRLVKEGKEKMARSIKGMTSKSSTLIADRCHEGGEANDSVSNAPKKESKTLLLRGSIHVERFTICLNKEHQFRRLLHCTLTGTKVVYVRNSKCQTHITGSVKDIFAFDPGSKVSCDSNRQVLSVVRNGDDEGPFLGSNRGNNTSVSTHNTGSKNFLTFQYDTFSKGGGIPTGADSSLGKVDDFLSITLLSMKFIYLRDR